MSDYTRMKTAVYQGQEVEVRDMVAKTGTALIVYHCAPIHVDISELSFLPDKATEIERLQARVAVLEDQPPISATIREAWDVMDAVFYRVMEDQKGTRKELLESFIKFRYVIEMELRRYYGRKNEENASKSGSVFGTGC